LAIGFLAFLACSVAGTLLLLVRYEPQHYVVAAVPPGPPREAASVEFQRRFSDLISAAGGDHEWWARFTQAQINSYLAEAFVQSGVSKHLLPEGIRDPRVILEQDRIRLAFRYHNRLWKTVISIDLRVWLPKREPNVVALQLESFHAGVLPVSAQWLLERISEVCQQNGIGVNWYRHEGYPVALLRFQADQPRATLQLRAIRLEPETITIHGQSTDPLPGHTELQAPQAPPRPRAN
jgi:hypothetical protein